MVRLSEHKLWYFSKWLNRSPWWVRGALHWIIWAYKATTREHNAFLVTSDSSKPIYRAVRDQTERSANEWDDAPIDGKHIQAVFEINIEHLLRGWMAGADAVFVWSLLTAVADVSCCWALSHATAGLKFWSPTLNQHSHTIVTVCLAVPKKWRPAIVRCAAWYAREHVVGAVLFIIARENIKNIIGNASTKQHVPSDDTQMKYKCCDQATPPPDGHRSLRK